LDPSLKQLIFVYKYLKYWKCSCKSGTWSLSINRNYSSLIITVHSEYLQGPQKPEAFKSNNPGYIRGKSMKNLSTPERVEVGIMKIRLLKEEDINYINDIFYLRLFNTSGVVDCHGTATMDETMDIRLGCLRHHCVK
jgi:hypothetical protein